MGSASMSNSLFIRADANRQLGSGHVMRCLALDQAWQETGGEALFITTCDSDALLQRLSDEGCGVIALDHVYPDPGDWSAVAQVLAAYPNAWVVLDGYHFDSTYQRHIKEAGHRLLVIDDMAHLAHYYADIVLNQNMHVEQLQYTCETYTRLLLGLRYTLLRREFWPWQGWQREISAAARKVLVTMGGADPDNVTLKVIQALQEAKVDKLETVIVVGANNPHHHELKCAVRRLPFDVRLERNVADMPSLMAWADVAISAGGSTCWELAFMGLPHLILVLADNQEPVAAGLDAAGAALYLGRANELTPAEIAAAITQLMGAAERRAAMAQQEQRLVDGEGARRAVWRLRRGGISLRPAQPDDCRLVWEWVNDPTVRAASFSSDPISWETHVAWFTARLADPNTLFYLVLDAAVPIGQVRYMLNGGAAEISISLAPNCRGQGYGSHIICMASRSAFVHVPIDVIHAYIKPDNIASVRAFANAGFVESGTVEVRGQMALHFVLDKDIEI